MVMPHPSGSMQGAKDAHPLRTLKPIKRSTNRTKSFVCKRIKREENQQTIETIEYQEGNLLIDREHKTILEVGWLLSEKPIQDRIALTREDTFFQIAPAHRPSSLWIPASSRQTSWVAKKRSTPYHPNYARYVDLHDLVASISYFL
jgi:hypothetical protein